MAYLVSFVVMVEKALDYDYNILYLYLLEFNRVNLLSATRISNPGCYATGSQVAIRPLLPFLSTTCTPTIFGVSGYSGAGTKPSPKNDPAFLQDNLIPYSLTDHIHEREIGHQLGRSVAFIPHVAPFFQGIMLTVSVPLEKSMTHAEVKEVFEEFYQGEQLVKVTGAEVPLVRDNAGKHFVRVGGFGVHSKDKRVVVVATIDNLLKGAATQALQVSDMIYYNLAHEWNL